MELTVRPVRDSEFAHFCRQTARGFGADLPDEDVARIRKLIDPERTRCAFAGEQMVGTCAAYSLQVAVPGTSLSMAGTTDVTVEQTHRRRGVLRAMMRAHLDEVRSREEALAGLWASQGSIYSRFGFGVAAEADTISMDCQAALFDDIAPSLTLRTIDAEHARQVLPVLYQRVWPSRPGMLARAVEWWDGRILNDPERERDGASAYRYVVSEGSQGIEGYAIYRQRMTEAEFGRGTVEIKELVSESNAAHAALWRFLTSIDLFPKVTYWNAPPDDELRWRVMDHYRVERRPHDNLWIRIMDIPQAFSARRYMASGRITLAVFDEMDADRERRFALDVSPDGGACTETRATPELSLGLATVGALYLGKRSAHQLARAGLISGPEASLAKIDRLLGWIREPWCAEVF